MSWISITLNSSIGKKVIVALTGLFLITFLVGHLAGNLQLLIADKAVRNVQFNEYAYFMTHNPLIKILSWATYISILIHIIYSSLLTWFNQRSRPVAYAVPNQSKATYASKNMWFLGSIILVFIIIHLKDFWYVMHFGEIGICDKCPSEGAKQLYMIVEKAFREPFYVLFYLISMSILAFHLSHGFGSAFQTLGLNHKKYSPFIKTIGLTFSVIVPILFGLIPVYLLFE